MKRLILLLTLLVCWMPIFAGDNTENQHPSPINPNATKEARELLHRLYTNVDNGKIISGLHHNQLKEPNYSKDLRRIDEASGKTPLIWGGDVAWDAEKVVEMATEHYRKGYIVTLMWHAARPFDTGIVSFKHHTQGKITDKQWEDLITPGTEMNRLWLAQVDSISQYLRVLQERNIPVIWRPLHEMNGGWFWWGYRKGADGYQKLWRMLYERMTIHNGLNNLLWVWNANATQKWDVTDKMRLKDYFPGSDVVDILATDVYENDWRQCHHDDLAALANGKLIAIGETGPLPTPQQLSAMPKFAWFMIWTSFTSDKYNSLQKISDIFSMPNVITYNESGK